MRRSSCFMCALCIIGGLSSLSKANAQASWSCVAVLKEADRPYPVHLGDATDSGFTYVESNNDGYTGAASLYRAANSAATVQSVWADQASYTVTWTLTGNGVAPSLSVFSDSVASAYLASGVSSGQDVANVGIAGIAEVSATTQGLQAGQTDTHNGTTKEEVVTRSGQVTCDSQIHPAAAVSQPGQGMSCTATFKWREVTNVVIVPPAG